MRASRGAATAEPRRAEKIAAVNFMLIGGASWYLGSECCVLCGDCVVSWLCVVGRNTAVDRVPEPIPLVRPYN